MNREVSDWMRGLSDSDGSPRIPFLATHGYDSVVWNRLYSRDTSDLEDYQISQASILNSINYFRPFIIQKFYLVRKLKLCGDYLIFKSTHA